MKSVYKNSWFWFGLAVLVFLINQLVNIVDLYPAGYDEAWYGNPAYNFAKGNGFLNTIVGSRGNANFLFPTIAGTFMHMFGYNLLAIRLANVFCGVLALVFLCLCFREMKVSWQSCALSFLFFVSIELYNYSFRLGRPEGCAMMCLSGGVWMYLRYKESQSWWDMVGLSFFTYIAACAHPFALLPFALMGVYQLIEIIQQKQWMRLWQLVLLLMAAIAAIASIAWVSNTYNIAGEDYVETRFSPVNIILSVPKYVKSIFLNKRHVLYMLFLIFVTVFMVWRRSNHKDLALIALVHLTLFPILFSTDLNMVGFGSNYFVLIATILIAPFMDMIGYEKKWKASLFIIFCVCNLGVTYWFNYSKQYDCVNRILEYDFQQLIPRGSKIFGPIRQWLLVMETDYHSDHAYFPINNQEYYDFIILNSQDVPNYPIYEKMVPKNSELMELIYERDTKQYGLIQVYRNKKASSQHTF